MSLIANDTIKRWLPLIVLGVFVAITLLVGVTYYSRASSTDAYKGTDVVRSSTDAYKGTDVVRSSTDAYRSVKGSVSAKKSTRKR